MFHVHTGDSLAALVADLAGVLRAPLSDPMAAEWVGVPTQGVKSWLEVELAGRLGARPGRADGIAANFEFFFARSIRRRLVEAYEGSEVDPWQVDRLVWPVMEVLAAAVGDRSSPIAPVAALAGGVTIYGQAARLADLLDRYVNGRPEMIRRWAAGDSVNAAGDALEPNFEWQRHLFTAVRSHIGRPSPAERFPSMLEAVRSGELRIDLPERVSMFGFTTLVGGQSLLDQLEALGSHRDVHLFLWEPSPGLGRRVREMLAEHPAESTPFGSAWPSPDPLVDQLHPLVRSWATPSRDAMALLAGSMARGVESLHADPTSTPPPTAAPSLLAQLQQRLRAADSRLEPFVVELDSEGTPLGDGSLALHACHGQIRQVEVLRDEVLHLLAADPTLDESDILIVSPDLGTYAPLVEAVFGESAPGGFNREVGTDGETPRLLYSITDRSVARLNPVLGGLSTLLDMVAGRFGASTVSDFIGLPPVMLRYGLDDESFGVVLSWISELDVRWGLSAEAREPWLQVDDYAAGSWAAALDRLLTGIALSDHDDVLGIGVVVVHGVEGGNIELAGRLCEILTRLGALSAEVRTSRPNGEWRTMLTGVIDDFFRAPFDASWQTGAAAALLADIVELSESAEGRAHPVLLSLADIRRLLADHIGGSSAPSKFLRGGVTITSMSPLRGVPYRVVCVLGFDDAALRSGGGDGDDLLALEPRIGDRDRRGETRQSLLETVMSATDRLVITRTGTSRINNKPVPMTAALAELRDALVDGAALSDAEQVNAAIELAHPCNAFDPHNFHGDRRSFDSTSLAGARLQIAKVSGESPDERGPFLAAPLELDEPLVVVDLEDLHSMLRSPVAFFLKRRLGVALGGGAGAGVDEEIPLGLDGLGQYAVGEDLLAVLLEGGSDEQFRVIEGAKGSLPPGVLADAEVDPLLELATAIVERADTLGVGAAPIEQVHIDLHTASGVRVVGSVDVVRTAAFAGPLTMVMAKLKPKRALRSWLDLMAVVAADQDESWEALLIGKDAGKEPVATSRLSMNVDENASRADRSALALGALEVVVDLYRRALCGPVPLFAETSRGLFDDAESGKEGTASKLWGSDPMYDSLCDRFAAETQLAYGDLEFEEFVALAPTDEERSTFDRSETSRAKLFANLLWRAITRTTTTTATTANGVGGATHD